MMNVSILYSAGFSVTTSEKVIIAIISGIQPSIPLSLDSEVKPEVPVY